MKTHILQMVIAASVASSTWVAAPAVAQEEPGHQFEYRYTAYFVCGTPKKSSGGQLVSGRYATQINMANWHGKELELRKKVALTYPPRMQVYGVHSDWVGPETIERNHALSVDCEEIVGTRKFPSEFKYSEGEPELEDGKKPTFYTGYLIIQSSRSLNVTTVQTAGPRPGREGSDDDDHEQRGKKGQPQVHTISVTNVPERTRAESRKHDEEGA